MRALISVSDKTGVVELAKALEELGCTVMSTGGTARTLSENGVNVVGISDVTGFPECLDGRVKTLHPAVHGGILAMRDKKENMDQCKVLGIQTFDIVTINLYPFSQTVSKPGVTMEEAIENIDIGGPTMLRSAAKNHRDVVVLCDPADYEPVLSELKEKGSVSYETKYRLALKVFQHTAAYDALIADYLRVKGGYDLPDNLTMTFEKVQDLRYGENPHQKAYYYKELLAPDSALVNARQINGKELSFNNINDTNAALSAVREFKDPAIVAVKHANPCGIGVADNLYDAYKKAYDADPISIFGGIIASNRVIDGAVAAEINKIFLEIVIAPGFSPEALEILMLKKNLRLLSLPSMMKDAPCHKMKAASGQAPQETEEKEKPQTEKGISLDALDLKKVSGGLLVQQLDQELYQEEELKVVTKRTPTLKEWEDLKFAMIAVKHIKSNGIVLAKDEKTIGMGPGQTNRIWAVEHAIKQATEDTKGAVLASDAFFPFDDCVTAAAAAGITAIIQPGGSIRDEDSSRKADQCGIAMVFTGMRHFRH